MGSRPLPQEEERALDVVAAQRGEDRAHLTVAAAVVEGQADVGSGVEAVLDLLGARERNRSSAGPVRADRATARVPRDPDAAGGGEHGRAHEADPAGRRGKPDVALAADGALDRIVP